MDSLELVALAGWAADQWGVREAGLEDYFLAKRTLGAWADLILTSWTRTPGPTVVFASSGTTGTPRENQHRLPLLVDEVRELGSRIPGTRVLKSVPGHHIYGFLFTTLFPALRGLPVVDLVPEAPGWQSGDILVTHPVHLRLWRGRSLVLPPDSTVVTSTSALDQESWGWLEGAGCRVLEIFGSSETSGIGWRTSALEPFELLPYWTFTAEPEGRLTRPGRAPVPAPDALRFTGPRTFYPEGRRDQGLKIGGHLVHLDAVRRVLLDHPGVTDCTLRTEETPLGLRIKAFVVPRTEGTPLEADLRAWVAARLDTPARPYAYTFGPQVPEKVPGQSPW